MEYSKILMNLNSRQKLFASFVCLCIFVVFHVISNKFFFKSSFRQISYDILIFGTVTDVFLIRAPLTSLDDFGIQMNSSVCWIYGSAPSQINQQKLINYFLESNGERERAKSEQRAQDWAPSQSAGCTPV